MTLDQLRIFIAVAESLHLTRAAESIGLTPSAVSSAIRVLERNHQMVLFNRVGRRLELTREGEELLPAAKSLVEHARQTEFLIAELNNLEKGTIRVHATQSVSGFWLPEKLVRFRHAYPGIDINIEVANTVGVAEAVLSGHSDIGFVEAPISDDALSIEEIAEDTLAVVVSPEHPWAKKGRISLEEVAQSKWVMRERGSATRSTFERALQDAQIDPLVLDHFLTLPSNGAICSAAAASNDLATIVSLVMVQPYLDSGRLVRVQLDLPIRHFYLIARRDHARSRAVQAFEKMLKVSG